MTRMTIDKVRLAYCHLDVPRASAEGADPKFSCVMIIPKDHPQVAEIKSRIKEAVAAKFGDKPPKGLRNPLRDGDEIDAETNERMRGPEFANAYALSASGKRQPNIIVGKSKSAPQAEHLRSGHYASVKVNFYGYDTAGNRGVAAGLNGLWITHPGEPLGMASDPWSDKTEAEDFGAIAEKAIVQASADDDMF